MWSFLYCEILQVRCVTYFTLSPCRSPSQLWLFERRRQCGGGVPLLTPPWCLTPGIIYKLGFFLNEELVFDMNFIELFINF